MRDLSKGEVGAGTAGELAGGRAAAGVAARAARAPEPDRRSAADRRALLVDATAVRLWYTVLGITLCTLAIAAARLCELIAR